MYAILCRAISEALDVLPVNYQTLHSKLLLEKGLWEAEELYLQESDGLCEENKKLLR